MSPMTGLEGWDADLRPVVKETHLSRKPARASFVVAVASMAILLAASLIYWSDAFGLGALLPASREAVFGRGEHWRLLTSIFVHADFQHFLSNAIVFGILAFLVYGYYGPLIYPTLSLAVGALVTALSLRTYPPETSLIGASGVVYLMAAFWLTLYLLVERRTRLRMRLVRAIGFGLIVLVPTAVEPLVSYRTHAIGFAAGTALGLIYFWKQKESLRAEERIELE
jgi:rhomboid protease GluP